MKRVHSNEETLVENISFHYSRRKYLDDREETYCDVERRGVSVGLERDPEVIFQLLPKVNSEM